MRLATRIGMLTALWLLAWVMTTPLGRPVDPDVYATYAALSG